MLTELIEELKRGGTLDIKLLANRLNTTPEMISMMIEHLQRDNLVKRYESCHDGCDACTLASLCSKATDKRGINVWQYEERSAG